MRRSSFVALLLCLGISALPSSALARPCSVPNYDCFAAIDGFGSSELDIPSQVPGIAVICKRDAGIYRVCARTAPASQRDEVLMSLALVDDVVADADQRLHRSREGTVYAREARALAGRLVGDVHLSDDERSEARGILSGPPKLNAYETFMSRNSFEVLGVIMYALFFGPILLALAAVVAGLVILRRQHHRARFW